MLNGLWRLYRGCAVAVLTLQLVVVLSLGLLVLARGWAEAPSLAGIIPSRVPTPSATPAALGAPTRAPTATAIPARPRLVIEMSEEELNAAISRELDPSTGVEQVEVAFDEQGVAMTALATRPIRITVRAHGTLAAVDGGLKLHIDRATAGPFGLPAEMVGRLENTANQALADMLAGENAYVEGVETLPGRVRLLVRREGSG